jgi:HAD superfamily hydrolase (TIGR01490 family)
VTSASGSRYAFFDLDGTLISDTSMMSFYQFYLEYQSPASAPQRWRDFTAIARSLREAGATREEQNRAYYRLNFEGASIDELGYVARQWLARRSQIPGFWVSTTVRQLRRHQAEGTRTVLLTGSFREIAKAVAEALDIDGWICAPLEEDNGCYTGVLTGRPTIGIGKVHALERFVAERDVDLDFCYGYGDDESDIPFLQCMGSASIVASATPGLREHALKRGWPTLSDDDPIQQEARRSC